MGTSGGPSRPCSSRPWWACSLRRTDLVFVHVSQDVKSLLMAAMSGGAGGVEVSWAEVVEGVAVGVAAVWCSGGEPGLARASAAAREGMSSQCEVDGGAGERSWCG